MITESVQHVLTVLYPLYKEEVYQRRGQMMRLTVIGSLGLITMLFAFLLSPHHDRLTSLDALFTGVAGMIWCGLFCGLIFQQQYRHRQAKQVLVQLEQALGFYEEGLVDDLALLVDRIIPSRPHFFVTLRMTRGIFTGIRRRLFEIEHNANP
jgi:hypothetical protein